MNLISRYAALIFSFLLIGAIIYFFPNIVAYFLISWVLAMLGQPLMRFFRRYLRIGRFQAGPNLAALLTLLCYFAVAWLVLSTFVPLILAQAGNLAGVDYSEIAQALEEPAQALHLWLQERGLEGMEISMEEQLRRTFSSWLEPAQIGNWISALLSAAGSILIGIFAVVFITFFFLKDEGLFVEFLLRFLPAQYEEHFKNAIQEITRLLRRYFGGILVQITIITIYVTIGLSILGVENALLIGFFAALINVIPYIGPIIGATFGVMLTISTNLDLEFYTQMLPLILKVIAVFASMQLLDNLVLQPWIFSTSVLAHPLEVFIIILMGAKLSGIVGMILAIPTYTVLRVIARTFLSEFEIVRRITESVKRNE